nr:flagellar assembly protein FliH [Variovorax paradoxus]
MTSSSNSSFGARARLSAAYAPARPATPPKPAKPVLSAWQRWEMGTLEEDAAPPQRDIEAANAQRIDPAALAREAELERLRLEARAAGLAEGRREGWAQGHAEGRTNGLAAGLAAASAHAEQLRALAATLPDALRRAENELADAILTLALDVARQVVHRTLRAEPEWVLPLVQDLLHAEPALQGEPRLLLHPDDVALVKNSLGNELQIAGWQVRADDTLARGGCRVQSASGEMDASLETRWKSVTAALHRDVDALDI